MSFEPTTAMQKKGLRQEMRARRQELPEAERRAATMALHKVLAACPVLRGRLVMMAYMAIRGEPCIEAYLRPFIVAGGRLVLPRIAPHGKDFEAREVASLDGLVPGYQGILEPDPLRSRAAVLAEIEAVLVPGLAFDRRGARLGQGGGHYDRFLAGLPPTAVTIGIAHDFQLVDRVPAEPHDIRMDWIALPSGLVACDKGGE